jgi:hypothetical protein
MNFKRSTEYYFTKALHLQRRVEELESDLAWKTNALNEANNKPRKKFSKYFVVFKTGYVDPVIVEADGPEEALCPEGCEVPRGDFCQRLWDESEYTEL